MRMQEPGKPGVQVVAESGWGRLRRGGMTQERPAKCVKGLCRLTQEAKALWLSQYPA